MAASAETGLKGFLPLVMNKNNDSPPDYMHPFTLASNDNLPNHNMIANYGIKEVDPVSIQAFVRCLISTASQVSGKITTLLYNGKSVCYDTTPLSLENHLFRRVRSEDVFISRDERLGSTSPGIAFVLAPSCSLW